MASIGTAEVCNCACAQEQSALRAEMAQRRGDLEARVERQELALGRLLATLVPAVEAVSARMDRRTPAPGPSRGSPASSTNSAPTIIGSCSRSAPAAGPVGPATGPVTGRSTCPASGSATDPATGPVTAPASDPVTGPTIGPVTDPTTDHVTGPVTGHARRPAPTLPPLHTAASAGDAEGVRRLLAQGDDPTARDTLGENALYYAATAGHVAALDALLEAAQTAAPDEEGRARWAKWAANVRGRLLRTPLHAAAAAGHVDAACSLLAAGASVDAADVRGDTPLHLAAARGRPEVAALLLAEGAAIDAVEMNGLTPMMAAATHGHVHLVRLLLEKGADPHHRDAKENTALHWATAKGSREIVQLLLEKGLDVQAKGAQRRTPLHEAAGFGHVELIEMLLAKEHDIAALADYEITPLLLAAKAGHANAVEMLLARGASVQEQELIKRNGNGYDVDAGKIHLVQAAEGGSARAVKALFFAGATTQAPVMRLAIERALNADVVWALLDIDPDNFRSAAQDALLALATAGNTAALKAVLATGVEVSKEHLALAFKAAAKHNRAECVAALLDTGVTDEKQEALHEAVKNGHKRCLSEFLQRGITDEQKVKAMAVAKENSQVEVMRMLVEAGANPFAVDSKDIWELIKRFQEQKMLTIT